MSGTVARESSNTPVVKRPHVYIRTFGQIRAWVGGRLATLSSGGVGRHQLRRQLGWLVGHRGIPVSLRQFGEIAGGRARVALKRPPYRVQGLLKMLREWGLGVALLLGDRYTLTLVPHELWGTDTDELEQLLALAEAQTLEGNREIALVTLEQAALHCLHNDGVRHLHELLEDGLPNAHIRARSAYWSGVQRDTLRALATLCLYSDDRQRHRQALAVAVRATELYGAGRAELLLAGQAADRLGRPLLGDDFRRRANQLDQE